VTTAVEAQLNVGSVNYLGRAKVGNTYYGLFSTGSSDFTFFKVVLDSTDQYQYQYSKPNAGDVLRDLGIMTDSLIHIDPDGLLQFQSRSGMSEIPSIPEENVRSLKVETLDRRNEKLELPEAFTIAQSVQAEMIDHYDPIYRGAFNRSLMEIEREALSGYTLPLRKIVIGDGDHGIVKEIILHERSIELIAEKRL
jgi:hypothetical protein